VNALGASLSARVHTRAPAADTPTANEAVAHHTAAGTVAVVAAAPVPGKLEATGF